jgi:hypothetical protein
MAINDNTTEDTLWTQTRFDNIISLAAGNVPYTLKNFTNAVLTNDGTTDLILSNYLGETYNLKPKEVFRWNDRAGYYYIIINVTDANSIGRLGWNN